MNKRILYAGIISLALAMIFSACPPPPDPVPDPDPTSVPDPTIYTVTVTDENLDQMKSLIAEAAEAGGGTSKTNPIVVKVTISDASLLSGTGSNGVSNCLSKLFDAIPSNKYVSYDLSGCTFTSFDGMGTAYSRTNRDYLVSISLPETLTSIEDIFSYWTGLTSISIPNSVTSIAQAAFSNCRSLTSVIIGNSVTSIGDHAFYNTALTSVIIPDSVISISDYAFNSCSNLTSVIIGNSVISIGDRAFSGCSNLTSISIPDSVTSIGYEAFDYCSNLASAIIGNGITSIGDLNFYQCYKLTSIRVSESNPSYTSIDGVLFDKAGTTLVKCPLGKEGTYTIPNTVTTIGYEAFYFCKGLTSIIIPDSVTSISERAFWGCDGLTSVSIGNGITSIDTNTFYQWYKLTSIRVSESHPSYKDIDGVLFDKAGTTLVKCPPGKEGTYTIPNTVTTIGYEAFYFCSGLTSIIIPDSVTSIGDCVFWGCSGLTSVYMQGDTPPALEMGAFTNTNASLKIYVPAGTVGAYEAADGWSSYKDKIQ
ncbi:hypothetical protein FACS1894172_08690 [Spirochaetia bacterium]|nr:hypothetical protein FACS1894172_08690 [Spirochaetia bacterium]